MMTYHEAYQYLVENHVKIFGFGSKPTKQKEKIDKKRLKELKRRRSFHAVCATEYLIQSGLTAKEERLIHETEQIFSSLNMEDQSVQNSSRRRSLTDKPDFARKSSLKSKKMSLAVEPRRSRSARRNSLQVDPSTVVDALTQSSQNQESVRRRKSSKRSKSRNKNLSPEVWNQDSKWFGLILRIARLTLKTNRWSFCSKKFTLLGFSDFLRNVFFCRYQSSVIKWWLATTTCLII